MKVPDNTEAIIDVSNGLEIFNIAERYLGTPYCHGGESPRCFDCSGFTQYVYSKEGIELDRTTDGQRDQAEVIPADEAIVGDLVFFSSRSGYVYHVGIYAGDGKVLHSPKPGRSVKIETIWSSNVTFGRI